MLFIEKLSKHDQYVSDLVLEISSFYDSVHLHVPFYSKKKRLIAEVDILAVKRGFCDIYEVKCSHRITKARKQLYKIKKIISDREAKEVRNSFFYCGESGQLVSL